VARAVRSSRTDDAPRYDAGRRCSEEMLMSTTRSDRGCATTGCVALVCIFVPIVGHIILTFMILEDDYTIIQKTLWLVLVWVVWFIGPFIYLFFGQRANRVLPARNL
jgi:hypothetical protein